MNESEISQYITGTFEDVDVVTDSGNSFFFYNPDRSVPPDHRLMFATLVTNDLYDQFSNLDRPSIFRLNIGIGKSTFRSLFGEPSLSGRDDSAISNENASAYDFTTLDQILPHPEYGRILWVCVLSPGEETFETKVRQFLAEAYDLAVNKYRRLATRR